MECERGDALRAGGQRSRCDEAAAPERRDASVGEHERRVKGQVHSGLAIWCARLRKSWVAVLTVQFLSDVETPTRRDAVAQRACARN